jgi:sulfide:quinone oxidoreductase
MDTSASATNRQTKGRSRVVIVGGGVTGLEILLALSDLAGDLVEMTLVAPQPDFIYRPLLVEEPFGLGPAERHELAPLAEEHGATLVRGALSEVRATDHAIGLEDGTDLGYDMLAICVGGRLAAPFAEAVTFPGEETLDVDGLIHTAAKHQERRVAFVVPPGVSWPLPLYELALMTERRVRELGEDVGIVLVTPESAPLTIFGTTASDEVADLLRGRGIELHTGAWVRRILDGAPVIAPSDDVIDAAVTVALATVEGPGIAGLPDDAGFVPTDQHARVKGVADVWACGDGANFPVKQGGLGTQQADAAAEDIAARAGAEIEPKPFHPILRGMLLTGDESVHMETDVTGGHGEGAASADRLWWPPHKIGGRYLAAWLANEDPQAFEPPRRALDVEVALPKEWHENPMLADLHQPPDPPEDG